MRQGIFLPEPASGTDSLTVSAQPQCTIACTNTCAHVENTKHWPPCHCLDTCKYYTYTDRNGYAAPAAAVPYPGKATRIFRNGLKNKKKILKASTTTNNLRQMRYSLDCQVVRLSDRHFCGTALCGFESHQRNYVEVQEANVS